VSLSLIVTLRVLHIVCGAIWVGAVVIATFFIFPSVGAMGPAGGQFMKQFMDRKYPQVVMSLMGITILSGLGLMYTASVNYGGSWFASPMGRMISLGAAIAIVASVFGSVIARPSAMRMQKLGAEIAAGGGAPSPDQAAEMKKLQGKLTTSGRIIAVLMILAVAAMAGARYAQ
jgi:hypothetical protein